MRLSAARVDSGQEKSALVACRPAKDAQSTLFRMGGGFLSLSLLLVPRFRRSIWPNKIERLPIRHFFLFPKNEKFDRWSFQRKGNLPSRSCPLDS